MSPINLHRSASRARICRVFEHLQPSQFGPHIISLPMACPHAAQDLVLPPSPSCTAAMSSSQNRTALHTIRCSSSLLHGASVAMHARDPARDAQHAAPRLIPRHDSSTMQQIAQSAAAAQWLLSAHLDWAACSQSHAAGWPTPRQESTPATQQPVTQPAAPLHWRASGEKSAQLQHTLPAALSAAAPRQQRPWLFASPAATSSPPAASLC